MKRLLFAAAMFFAAALFINVDAYAAINGYMYAFNSSGNSIGSLGNSCFFDATNGNFTAQGYSFNKPVAVVTSESSRKYVFFYQITRWNNWGNTSGFDSNNANHTYVLESYHHLTVSGFPIFNNFNDASLYSRGLAYNPAAVIGGEVPYSNIFSTDRDYQPYINFADIYYGYEDFFGISIQGLSTTLDMQLRDPAQVPNYTNSRVQLVYYVPTSLSMDSFLADYDMGSGVFQASSINIFMREHPDFRYNNTLTYESHAISKNVDFSETTRFTEVISDYSTWGNHDDLIYNQLLSIYGNDSQKALYAYLLLMRYDYVSVAHYSDNTSSKVRTVYPAGFYYFNLYNYDNSLFKKRGVPVSPSAGTGSSAPTYDNPQNPNNYTGIPDAINDSLQEQLTNNINDSHNSSTIINNYYQGIDDRIDQFEDGTLNIDDTISNVVSVAKSVSHIGLIFGYLFNGFLPVEVITLLGFAFVLIPIIVIIKLIRG